MRRERNAIGLPVSAGGEGPASAQRQKPALQEDERRGAQSAKMYLERHPLSQSRRSLLWRTKVPPCMRHPLGEDVQLPRKLLGSACYSRGKFGSGTGAMLGLFFGGPSSHEASSRGTRF